MKAQHTPGPWSDTGHDGKLSIVVETPFGSVAKALPVGDIGQERANARLIAAAPELLAGLEAVLKQLCNTPCMSSAAQEGFSHHTAEDEYRIELCKLILEARETAIAAIAKARGQA